MQHHSTVPYEVATSEAAKNFRPKLQAILEKNQQSVRDVCERVETEVPRDAIVKSAALHFEPTADLGHEGVALRAGNALQEVQYLHPHALQQVVSRANINMGIDYARALTDAGDWGRQLLANSLNEVYHNSNGRRNLVRSVGHEVRGFLGGNFRRLDAAPMAMAFLQAVQDVGAIITDGVSLDTKVRIRAMLPHIFEPVPNELMLLGLQWNNSDYGDGPHGVQFFVLRGLCTNLALGDTVLRQVHIGKRLEDDIQFSQRTYDLDTAANVSKLKDVVQYALGPGNVHKMMATIKEANETPAPGDVLDCLKKKLNKSEAETVKAYYESPDVENLPPGKTTLRLSNAISWYAHQPDLSQERKLELAEVAGSFLPRTDIRPLEVKYE